MLSPLFRVLLTSHPCGRDVGVQARQEYWVWGSRQVVLRDLGVLGWVTLLVSNLQGTMQKGEEAGVDAVEGRGGRNSSLWLMKTRPFLCSCPLWPLCLWPVQPGVACPCPLSSSYHETWAVLKPSFPLTDFSAYPDLRLVENGHMGSDMVLRGWWERDMAFTVLLPSVWASESEQVSKTPLVHSVSRCLISQDGNTYLVYSRDCIGLPWVDQG